jgi:hypothetical protein
MGMRHLQPLSRLVSVVALATLIVAGCGSSGSSVPPTAAITATWVSFFGTTGNANQVQGMDAQLRPVYTKSRSGALGKGSSAKVVSVLTESSAACKAVPVPSPCAKVTYDILINGTAALSNATGYATKQGGKWYVSKNTFCSLISLENGSPPAGC